MLSTMAKKTNKHLISVHSLIDVITNSSTELFIVDKNKVDEAFKEVFTILMKELDWRGDGETEVKRLKDYEEDYNVYFKFSEDVDRDSVYIINADYHDDLLNHLIEKHFNPISPSDYEEEYVK